MRKRPGEFLIHVIAATALILPWIAINSGVSSGSVFSMDAGGQKDGGCLDCHGDRKNVGNRYLVEPERYRQTSHALIGCPACHDQVSPAHPADGARSARTNCNECHGDTAAAYGKSPHAAKASCGDCHDVHRVRNARQVSGRDMNTMCATCHSAESMEAKHARWLPQADLHLEMLPCVTCHTSSENYSITLYVIKRQGNNRYGEFQLAEYAELAQMAPKKEISSLIDGNGDNYISLTELQLFNRNPDRKLLRLQAVMTPEVATHSFGILENRRDCTFCHASGPGAMQSSTLALPDKSGAFRRLAVEKGAVLEAVNGAPDFYMTGATRNASLNLVGLAIIAGGLVMPVGHGFLRFLTRKNRKERRPGHE